MLVESVEYVTSPEGTSSVTTSAEVSLVLSLPEEQAYANTVIMNKRDKDFSFIVV